MGVPGSHPIFALPHGFKWALYPGLIPDPEVKIIVAIDFVVSKPLVFYSSDLNYGLRKDRNLNTT